MRLLIVVSFHFCPSCAEVLYKRDKFREKVHAHTHTQVQTAVPIHTISTSAQEHTQMCDQKRLLWFVPAPPLPSPSVPSPKRLLVGTSLLSARERNIARAHSPCPHHSLHPMGKALCLRGTPSSSGPQYPTCRKCAREYTLTLVYVCVCVPLSRQAVTLDLGLGLTV